MADPVTEVKKAEAQVEAAVKAQVIKNPWTSILIAAAVAAVFVMVLVAALHG